MTDPIISPWIIYWFTRIDSIKCFLQVFPLLFFLGAILVGILKGLVGEYDDYEYGEKNARRYVNKAIKYGLITIPLAIILNLFTPDTKTLATMYVANKLTISNVQMVGETADKVVDKAVEKIIKIIDATKEEKKK